jgi:hypothetical protein
MIWRSSSAPLAVVEAEVERIDGILEGYLDFSRPVETLRAESVALGDLIVEALASLEGTSRGRGCRSHPPGG